MMFKWKYSPPLFFICLLLVACGENNYDTRIVSLSTTHSEILIELEAEEKLVAVDMYVEIKKSQNIQRIDAFLVSLDEVLQLRPTHVIMAFPNDELSKELVRRNIQVYLFPPAINLEEVYGQIISISKIQIMLYYLKIQKIRNNQ